MKKILFVFIPFFLLLGCSSNIDVDGTLMTYDELKAEIEEKQSEIETVVANLESAYAEKDQVLIDTENAKSEYNSMKAIIDEATEFEENKEELLKELSEQEKELKELLASISAKQDELAAVSGEIKKKEGEPKVLSAGHYQVGPDLSPGRYIAEPNGGNGNFVVYSASDRLKVNTILGSGTHYESEYIFYAEEGDSMELSTRIKFSEVE
ncbi:hypothetical protein [Alkalihalobacillus sp. 1P02AB]|uniref:hypothetical protein n=1 Tax=Alkalihalobacillus sp. 1P02AB TaxID=3132260 RepID=UPI0039A6F23B